MGGEKGREVRQHGGGEGTGSEATWGGRRDGR